MFILQETQTRITCSYFSFTVVSNSHDPLLGGASIPALWKKWACQMPGRSEAHIPGGAPWFFSSESTREMDSLSIPTQRHWSSWKQRQSIAPRRTGLTLNQGPANCFCEGQDSTFFARVGLPVCRSYSTLWFWATIRQYVNEWAWPHLALHPQAIVCWLLQE